MSQRMSLVLHGTPPALVTRTLSERIGESIRSYIVGPMSLKDPELAKFYRSGSRTAAGPIVNELTALTCAAFWDGVNQISSDVAKLPLSLMKRRQGGGSDPYVDSPVYRLMKYAPNPETTSVVFRRTLIMHAAMSGNGYAEIVRDKSDRPKALWNLHPTRVQAFYDDARPGEDGRRKPLRYRIDGTTIIDARNMLHIQGLGDDGVTGYNMVSVAREALGLALASQQFAAAFFGNGTRFGGVLSSDQDLDDDQAKAVLDRVETLHAKADKAFRLLVLGQGFTFTESGVKPSDAQMTEIRQQQVVEVARYLNMPPHKLKELSRSTNNNIEHQDLEYYKGPILTWLTLAEQEYEAKLISPLERGLQFFKHNANAFLRGDIKSRYEALGIARDKGIINADEWREFEDWNPQPDGQGQLYLVQSAQVPVGKLADLVDAQIEATKQKAEPPASKTDADVRDATERAERAEQVAIEQRALADALRVQLAAVEATGTAKAEEVTALRVSAEQQQTLAANLTVLATDLRVQAERMEADRDTAEVGLADALLKQAAAEALIETARMEARTADEARAAAEGVAADARAKEEAAAAALGVAVRDLDLARDTTAADAAIEARIAEMQALLDSQRTSYEAEMAALTAALDQTMQERDAEQARTLAALSAGAAQRSEAMDRLAATIPAHRGLFVSVMGRIARREVEKARSHKATPEKLRNWLKTPDPLHFDICVEALLPAIKTDLAWKRSTEDPLVITTKLIEAHLAHFAETLRRVADTDASEYHALLAKTLERWETEQPERMADQVMAEQIAYLRAYEQQNGSRQ